MEYKVKILNDGYNTNLFHLQEKVFLQPDFSSRLNGLPVPREAGPAGTVSEWL